ncbi:MAG: DNA translocase FtsK 4TM domain-containing protein, partial [Spirochaetota bacterium]
MKHGKRTFLKILIIALGFFLLLTLIGFHPEDTLHFSDVLPQKVNHFLGRAGAMISAFLYYYIGRAAVLLSLVLIYTGYIIFRNLSTGRKTIITIVSVFLLITTMALFSLLNHEVLYRGGGILGRSIVLFMKDKRELAIPITVLIVIGEAFLLFVISFKGVLRKQKASSQGIDETSGEASGILTSIRRNKKPPFIKKVQVDENGNVIVAESTTQLRKSYSKKRIPRKEAEVAPEPSSGIQEQHLPDVSLLKRSKHVNEREREKETQKKARELEKTLSDFDIEAHVIGITRGPVITRY